MTIDELKAENENLKRLLASCPTIYGSVWWPKVEGLELDQRENKLL